jgi:hypothetical protein
MLVPQQMANSTTCDLTGKIIIPSSTYKTGGAYADVWQGEYEGSSVAIKVPRPAHVLEETRKVCFAYTS